MSKRFKYFVLLANMRTGSNLFEQNIRAYQEFSCHGELFNPHFIGYPNKTDLYGVDMTEREHKPQKLLNKLVVKEEHKVPGFRLFHDHDQRILEHCLNDPECAKIVLTRNPLDSYVSHAIARATDQWKLTDVSKRKKAKVHFDFVGFRSYLQKIQSYLRDINNSLQLTGQTAFHIGYDDLNNVDVFNGLVRFLGGSETLKSIDENIVRQNPEGLIDKVENYQEMRDQVQSIDLLGLEAVPILEQDRNPGSKNIIAGMDAPLLYLPMQRGGLPNIEGWIKAHQSGSKDMLKNASQKEVGNWLADRPIRQSFTILSHPMSRAYNAFYQHIFLSGDTLFPWIRNALENHYGMLLPDKGLTEVPNRTVLENSGFGLSAQRSAFLVFLKFLKGNLQGQTRVRVDQSWASQSSILQAYSKLVFPDLILRDTTIENDLKTLESRLGIPCVALEAASEKSQCFTLEEIFTNEMNVICKDAYARDYQMFGFSDWKDQ